MRNSNSQNNLIIVYLLISIFHIAAFAETSDKLWPAMKETYFPNQVIENAEFIKVSGPRTSENGGQVPITIQLEQNKASAPIKTLYLLIDENPKQLAATYKLSESISNLEMTTRVRMNSDSFIRLVAEDTNGKFFMAKTSIEAGGGCGGTINTESLTNRSEIGKIKLNVSNAIKPGDQSIIAFMIKHPMLSGLQRNANTNEPIPAYFANKAVFMFDNRRILEADFGVSTSENPYLRFTFDAKTNGTLLVQVEDTAGEKFVQNYGINL